MQKLLANHIILNLSSNLKYLRDLEKLATQNNFKRFNSFPKYSCIKSLTEKVKPLKISKYGKLSNFIMQKVKQNTPPYTFGILFTCHIVEQIQTYLCENKIVFDNRRKGNPANICTCTNASLFLEPFQLWQTTVKYTLHYPNPS